MMNIIYKTNLKPSVDAIIELYNSSGINRPIEDKARIQQMYDNSNLVVTAWDDDLLVGVARSVTDLAYCCYLSDLAVDKRYQNKKIGSELVKITKNFIGDKCMLLLLSAPRAMSYYPKLGFETVNNGFIIKRKS